MAAIAPRWCSYRRCAGVLRHSTTPLAGRLAPSSSLRRYESSSAKVVSHKPLGDERPLRVGIIGSGPAGFYAAARIIDKLQDAQVDMYEQLPVPFGLVRFGVAPDHPEVKNCEERFEEVATSPRFHFIGNIAIGRDIPLNAMKPHYDALLFAYGASEDKALEIPGEDLHGIYSARAFVGWYNGLPQYASLDPDLDSEHAVVIGNGNVALDVARILLSDVESLKETDISSLAMEALSKSKVKNVTVVGRRGPMQAAFTIKEVRELVNLPSVSFHLPDPSLVPSQEWISQLPKLQQRKYRVAKLLREGSRFDETSVSKHWSLVSLLSPASFNANSADNLGSITFNKNSYVDVDSTFMASGRVSSTQDKEAIPTNLAFRSIGYKAAPISGLDTALGIPFDERLGIIPNDKLGRVVGSDSEAPISGCYCAGWVKSGPNGVIASTMEDAFTTADIIAQDWNANALFLNGSTSSKPQGSGLGWEGVIEEDVVKRSALPRRVSWQDWLKIDAAERAKGRGKGKPRDKFQSTDDMLEILD